MSEANKEVLDAVMRALELEKETFDFYTAAAAKTANPAGKRVFQWLARSEEQHYLKLNELYTSLHTGGRWVFYGGSTITIDTADDGADHVDFSTDDRAALQIAQDIEQKGIDYFNGLLAKTTDPDGRAMLEKLRDEEQEHLRVIRERMR